MKAAMLYVVTRPENATQNQLPFYFYAGGSVLIIMRGGTATPETNPYFSENSYFIWVL